MPNKTKIEWTDYTLNPVKGLCPMACSYCYARRMYNRFKWDPAIKEDITVYKQLGKMKPGSRVFVGSTMELFGPWVSPLMKSNLYNVCDCYPELTFIFLTKRPQNLPKEWPDNCQVGISVTDHEMYKAALKHLDEIEAKVKFISFEPLLHRIGVKWYPPQYWGINWLIIGQQTPVSSKAQPKIEWVQEILVAAHNADIPVFIKDNLRPLINNSIGWGEGWKLRQELPELKVCSQI